MGWTGNGAAVFVRGSLTASPAARRRVVRVGPGCTGLAGWAVEYKMGFLAKNGGNKLTLDLERCF